MSFSFEDAERHNFVVTSTPTCPKLVSDENCGNRCQSRITCPAQKAETYGEYAQGLDTLGPDEGEGR